MSCVEDLSFNLQLKRWMEWSTLALYLKRISFIEGRYLSYLVMERKMVLCVEIWKSDANWWIQCQNDLHFSANGSLLARRKMGPISSSFLTTKKQDHCAICGDENESTCNIWYYNIYIISNTHTINTYTLLHRDNGETTEEGGALHKPATI